MVEYYTVNVVTDSKSVKRVAFLFKRMQTKEKEPVSFCNVQLLDLNATLLNRLESTPLCLEISVFLFGLTAESLLNFC